MSGIAGDAHIWTATTDPVPTAACGYVPEVDEETGQVLHAPSTGDTCADCSEATAPEVVPPTDPEA